jgi:hypothetical protein
MNKRFNWKLVAGIAMLILSVAFYYLHYLIFHDAHHIFIYLVGDIAFVFVEVLLVTIIIHQVLHEWEKQSHLKKIEHGYRNLLQRFREAPSCLFIQFR